MTYKITFTVYNKDNKIIKQGTMKVHNSTSEFHAKVRLDKYLSTRTSGYNRLVITACNPDNDINSIFGDIFNMKF